MSDESDRRRKGEETFERVLGRPPSGGGPDRGVRQVSYDHLWPEVWNRPGLSLRDRSLVTLAVLAAGGHLPQLRAHLQGARDRGVELDEVLEVMVQVAHYAGWPAGMSGQVAAEEVYAEAEDSGGG